MMLQPMLMANVLLLLSVASAADAFAAGRSLRSAWQRRSLAAFDDASSVSASASSNSTPSQPTSSSGPPFRLTHIDHVAIRCNNFALMFDFYHRILGCSIDSPRDEHVNRFGGALTHLRAGSCYIDLLACDKQHLTEEGQKAAERMYAGGVGLGEKGLDDVHFSAETSTLDHLCLRIDSFDQQESIEYLEGENVSIIAMGDRLGADGVGPSIYIYDPEQNVIELKGGSSNQDGDQSKVPNDARQGKGQSDGIKNASPALTKEDTNTHNAKFDDESANTLEESSQISAGTASVPSTPCNRICRYNSAVFDGKICIGCFREAYEIEMWQSMTPMQKSLTLLDCIDRRSDVHDGQESFEGAVTIEELTRQQKHWSSIARS